MSKTELLYFTETYLLKHDARIEQVIAVSEEKYTIILDRTIFHPQGGGQPSDIGKIYSQHGWIGEVIMTRMNSMGRVEHEIKISDPTSIPSEGETIILEVDEQVRMLHARLHTAGHLLSHAIEELDVPLKSTKGYHFPAGPYVEYSLIEDVVIDWNDLRGWLEECCNKMIKDDGAVDIILKDPGEVDGEGLSKKAQEADLVRYISVGGTKNARPCGGTHVKSLGDIGQMSIKKISTKNGVIRISYLVS